MTQDLKALLLELNNDHANAEALTRLLYQLGATGWPELSELAQALLNERSHKHQRSSQLNRTLVYLSTQARKTSSYQSANKRHREETERLIEQLRALLTDLELHLTLQAKDELTTLRDMLWLSAAQWLLERADEARDQALVNLLADLSSDLGERLLLDPKGFFVEAIEMISARLKGCGVGQGPLEAVGYDELFTGGVFEELGGVSVLKLSTAGALSALLHRAEAGERVECALELRPTLKLGEGCFRSLVKSELLGAVREALKDRTLTYELSDTTLKALLGDELTRLDHERLMEVRFIAERLEVLQLSKLNPMVLCPAGELCLGAEESVKITEPFLMGQTQVTQALWQAVMGENPSCFKGSDLPVEQVSWFDMVRFCNRLSELECFRPAYHIGSGDEPSVYLEVSANGYRLPTEREWVYAAKAGTELTYAGSEHVDEVAWYGSNSGFKTHSVATKKPNAWGLYDMSGNVWEWCDDPWRDPNAFKMNGGPCNDTSAPAKHVSRGGGWHYAAWFCHVERREERDADKRRNDLGGRLLRHNTDR